MSLAKKKAPFDEAASFLQSVCMGAKSQSKWVCGVNAVLLGLQTGISAHPGPARVLGISERRRSASPGHWAGLDQVGPVEDGALDAPLVNAEQVAQALLQLPLLLLTRLLMREFFYYYFFKWCEVQPDLYFFILALSMNGSIKTQKVMFHISWLKFNK